MSLKDDCQPCAGRSDGHRDAAALGQLDIELIYGALTGLIPTTAAGESGLVLRLVVRVGLNHSVADQPGQRSIVERAQTKKRRLALCARLGAHHLMAASSK